MFKTDPSGTPASALCGTQYAGGVPVSTYLDISCPSGYSSVQQFCGFYEDGIFLDRTGSSRALVQNAEGDTAYCSVDRTEAQTGKVVFTTECAPSFGLPPLILPELAGNKRGN